MNDEKEKDVNPEVTHGTQIVETEGSGDNGNGGNNNDGGASNGGDTPFKPSLRPLWMDLLIIVGIFVASTIILSIILVLFSSFVSGDMLSTGIIAQIMVYAVTIPAAIILMRRRGMKKPILPFSFRMADPLMILWGVALIFIMGVVIEPLINLFPASYMEDVNNLISETGGLGMLMTIVLAPVLEEILFRGVIQGGTEREYGPVRAIVVASAIFGIIHLVPQQVVNAFFCGLILGYVFYRTRSLVPVIAIHLLNNAFAYIMIRMSPANASGSLREIVPNDTWYWIVYGACTAVFVFVMYKLWRQLNKAEKKSGKSFF